MQNRDAAGRAKLGLACIASQDDSLFGCVRWLEQTTRQIAATMQNSFGK